MFMCVDWTEETVAKTDDIRLLFHGKFLDNSETLDGTVFAFDHLILYNSTYIHSDRRFPLGQTTTMHLVPKPGASSGSKGSIVL